MAKKKYIETPAKMWEYFIAYKNHVKSNPREIYVLAQKLGAAIPTPMEVPLTMEGFEDYCSEYGIIEDMSHYFANYEDRYSEFLAICRAIKRAIRRDQIEGGMVGQYNPSITQRLNNLTEKVDNRLVDGEGNDRSFEITLNIR